MLAMYPKAVTQIIDLCDTIYAEGVDPKIASAALTKINAIIDRTIRDETEELRGALQAMLASHRQRFALADACNCDACRHAEWLVGSRN